MKQRFQFLFFALCIVTFFACNSKSNDLGSNPAGVYKDCNGGSGFITIHSSGEGYTMHIDKDNKDFPLEKKSDGLFTGMNGTITLMYDPYKMHFMLTGWGDRRISLCNPKELN